MINFYIAQRTIYSLKVRSNTMLVYYDLCRRANQSDLCWPAKKTIAEDCSISKSSVTRALRELERVGLIITLARRRDLSNGQTSNYYYVFDTPQTLPSQPEEPPFPEADAKPEQKHGDDKPEAAAPAACTVQTSHSDLPSESAQSAPQPPVEAKMISSAASPEPVKTASEATAGETTGKSFNCKNSTPPCNQQALLNDPIFDTPPRVTVTPQEGIPKTKATFNPRKESIFSQVVQWYYRRKRQRRAGNPFPPAKNECL